MREWFESLDTRQRLILLGGASLFGIFLLWLLAWRPLAGGVDRLETEVEAQRETLLWMQKAAVEIRSLRGSGAQAGSAGLGGRSLLAVVDQSARSAGLSNGLKRIEPESADSVRVRLEAVSFDTVLGWLDEMSRQFGISASMVSIEREGAPGQVNMRLTLQALSS